MVACRSQLRSLERYVEKAGRRDVGVAGSCQKPACRTTYSSTAYTPASSMRGCLCGSLTGRATSLGFESCQATADCRDGFRCISISALSSTRLHSLKDYRLSHTQACTPVAASAVAPSKMSPLIRARRYLEQPNVTWHMQPCRCSVLFTRVLCWYPPSRRRGDGCGWSSQHLLKRATSPSSGSLPTVILLVKPAAPSLRFSPSPLTG